MGLSISGLFRGGKERAGGNQPQQVEKFFNGKGLNSRQLCEAMASIPWERTPQRPVIGLVSETRVRLDR